MKRILGIFSPFFHSALVVLIASLFVMSVVYAATTIGSNITTGGNLTVTGAASSTSATSTVYVQVGVGAASYTLFNFAGGDIYATDDLEVDDDANFADDVTIGDLLTLTRISVQSVTTTDSLQVGGYASTTGDLFVGGGTIDMSTSTVATTSIGVFVGTQSGGNATRLTSTTTVSVGENNGDTTKGCIELVRSDGTYVRAYIAGGTTTWLIEAGRCND